MAISERLRMPIIEGIDTAEELPHTVTYALIHRMKIDSFNDLPKDKRPPRDLWSKPFKLEKYFEDVFQSSSSDKTSEYEYDFEDIE